MIPLIRAIPALFGGMVGWMVLFIVSSGSIAPAESALSLIKDDEVSLQKALESDPKNINLQKALAGLYEKKGNFNKSIEQHLKIVALTPKNMEARHHLAEVYAWAGDFDNSIVLFKNILSENPENLQSKLGLAEVFRWTHRYAEAIQLYDEILKQTPESHEAIKGLAKTYALEGDFPSALLLLEKGTSLYPNDPDFLSEKGTVLAWQGHFKEGEGLLLKAISLSPLSDGNYRTLGDIYTWMKDYSRAAENYKKAFGLNPSANETLLDLAKAYQLDKKFELAEETAKDALRHAPNNHKALELLQEIRNEEKGKSADTGKVIEVMIEIVIFVGPLGMFAWFFHRKKEMALKQSRYHKIFKRLILPGLLLLFIAAVSLNLILGYSLVLKLVEALIFWTLLFSIVYLFWEKRSTDILLPETVLVIGAHPDDIELGTGGFLLKMKEEGKKVYGLVMSQGEKGTSASPEVRKDEAKIAAEALGLDAIWVLDFPDTHLREHITGMKKTIEEKMKELGIGLVLTHSPRETHGDHLAVFESAREAARQTSLLCFETVSTPQEFVPNFFVDITPHLSRKIKAIEIHKTQGNKFYMDPEMVRGRAAHRGLQAGIRYAEAFWIYRWIK